MVNDIFSNDIFNSKIKPPTSKTYIPTSIAIYPNM